jgi:hypothetical protein
MDLLVDWRATFRGAVEMLHWLRRELIRDFHADNLGAHPVSASLFPVPKEISVESVTYYVGRRQRYDDGCRGLTIYAFVDTDRPRVFVDVVETCMKMIGFTLFDAEKVPMKRRDSDWLLVVTLTTVDPVVTQTRVPN